MAGFSRTKLGVLLALTLSAACASPSSSSSTSSGATSTHPHTITTTVATTTTTQGGGGAGGMGGSPACNPPAGSLYAASAEQYAMLSPTSMCAYQGEVLLIVNTADV